MFLSFHPAILLPPAPDHRFKQSRCRCDEDAERGALIAKHRPSSEYERQMTFRVFAVAGSGLSKRIARLSFQFACDGAVNRWGIPVQGAAQEKP